MWSLAAQPETRIAAMLRQAAGLQSPPDSSTAILTPARNIQIPETKNLSWNDVTPKFGVSYDLFGSRKTALKASANKYVAAQGATGGLGNTPNPVNRLVLTTTRAWNDVNGDFVPQCELTNPVSNG